MMFGLRWGPVLGPCALPVCQTYPKEGRLRPRAAERGGSSRARFKKMRGVSILLDKMHGLTPRAPDINIGSIKHPFPFRTSMQGNLLIIICAGA